jgi:hypothetical protein
MILTIDINKELPGIYVARAEQCGVLVTEPQSYDCIEVAIREQALNTPPGFAHFVEFTYGGMSTGTLAVEEVPAMAKDLADRLVALNAEMYRIAELRRPVGG